MLANFTSRNGVHPETFRTKREYRTKIAAYDEFCRQDTKEAMTCIENKYGLIKLTNLYQINHYFCTFSQNVFCNL